MVVVRDHYVNLEEGLRFLMPVMQTCLLQNPQSQPHPFFCRCPCSVTVLCGSCLLDPCTAATAKSIYSDL